MLSSVNSCGLFGLDGFLVKVEADVGAGMPSFNVVGLPDVSIKEARDRVTTAIKNSGGNVPKRKIVINLAPANMKKEGSCYDLAIAIAIMSATEQIKLGNIDNTIFLGELSLDGSVKRINGVLPMVISAYEQGFRDFVVPFDNASEAGVVEGANIYPVKNIKEVVRHFSGEEPIKVWETTSFSDIFSGESESLLDFADVKGQFEARRGLEVAAAGNHNVLMVGPPGTGKTMLAKRIRGILPDLSFQEALETSKIHSIAGTLPTNSPLMRERPFRNPHHTVSSVALAGGGATPKPGELSLAHNGVLFLDEFPEFSRNVLEVMRQPLEDGDVTISRVNATITYPCNFMLIASMNPCKCGYLGCQSKQCTCTPNQVESYRARISGPLMDRIDLHVFTYEMKYKEYGYAMPTESTAEIKKRVARAREIQLKRYKDENIYTNSQLTERMFEKYCSLGETEKAILEKAFDRLALSPRAYSRIIKVARTIADLRESEQIGVEDVMEAIQYRDLDRKFKL